jgi:hypothetical protein
VSTTRANEGFMIGKEICACRSVGELSWARVVAGGATFEGPCTQRTAFDLALVARGARLIGHRHGTPVPGLRCHKALFIIDLCF